MYFIYTCALIEGNAINSKVRLNAEELITMHVCSNYCNNTLHPVTEVLAGRQPVATGMVEAFRDLPNAEPDRKWRQFRLVSTHGTNQPAMLQL